MESDNTTKVVKRVIQFRELDEIKKGDLLGATFCKKTKAPTISEYFVRKKPVIEQK